MHERGKEDLPATGNSALAPKVAGSRARDTRHRVASWDRWCTQSVPFFFCFFRSVASSCPRIAQPGLPIRTRTRSKKTPARGGHVQQQKFNSRWSVPSFRVLGTKLDVTLRYLLIQKSLCALSLSTYFPYRRVSVVVRVSRLDRQSIINSPPPFRDNRNNLGNKNVPSLLF